MPKIHFIVNPIAGSGTHNFSESYFQDYFESNQYNLTVKYSEYKGHAVDLTKESIAQDATIIVACGGDTICVSPGAMDEIWVEFGRDTLAKELVTSLEYSCNLHPEPSE